MNSTETIEKILDIIINDESSTIKKFSNCPVPGNDLEYLELWFSHIRLTHNDHNLIEDFLGKYDVTAEDFEFKYQLLKTIKNYIIEIFDQKISGLKFQPRLEKYLQKIDESDRKHAQKLILAYLYHYSENRIFCSMSLSELARKYNLDRQFIYSLTLDHPIFKDRILTLENGILNKEKFLIEKDLGYRISIFKIFAGLQLNETDLASIASNTLLQDFNIETGGILIDDGSERDDNPVIEEEEELIIESFEDLLKEEDNLGDQVISIGEVDRTGHKEIKKNIDYSNDISVEPYKDDLDYLHEEYKWISMIKRLRELKKDEDNPFMETDGRSIPEIEPSVKRQKNICRIRLKRSKEKGFVPRLEKIASKLRLNEFEKNVIKVLIVQKIFVKADIIDNMQIKVGDLLVLLIDDPKEQVKEKKSFLKKSKLVKYSLIQFSSHNSLEESIYNANISLDNRLLEYLGGEDFDFSDYYEGGLLYKSKIRFESVILQQTKKDKIIEMIENFPLFLKAKKGLDFSDIVNYGNSLVMLFVGPSGTGKTMTANSIAEYLNKKMLTINLNQGVEVPSSSSDIKLLPLIFREARINDAVLFFDESEYLLSNRLTDLLLEIEKHEGIVIFATNASFKVDDAIRRRLNIIIDFEEPGPSLRKKIWEIHLPKKIKLNKDVDIDYIAKKYELNGGLIKNAMFSALAYAVNQTKGEELIIKMEHLEYGAKEQLHNKLFMSKLDEKKIPLRGIDSMILNDTTVSIIKDIINFEKAKKVLEGEWGFKDIFPEAVGTSVLFHGASGTGKTLAAECIAFETGKTLRIVNYAQVVSMWVGGTEKALETLLKESADNDSIILFDEADSIFSKRTDVRNSTDRYANLETDVLLNLIERNNVFAILTTNHLDSIDYAFFRRMRFIVEFTNPEFDLRFKLWDKLLPSKLPLNDDVDFKKLSYEYDFNGGDIKNAIIRAATRKAIHLGDDKKVDMKDFIEVCNEINKFKNGKKFEKIGFYN
jgi:SpoVK/Ycf46/Vps4 family AAA+-type ATPase